MGLIYWRNHASLSKYFLCFERKKNQGTFFWSEWFKVPTLQSLWNVLFDLERGKITPNDFSVSLDMINGMSTIQILWICLKDNRSHEVSFKGSSVWRYNVFFCFGQHSIPHLFQHHVSCECWHPLEWPQHLLNTSECF